MALELNVSKRASSERGAEVIEFAIILPMLLLVIFGIVDFGFLFKRYQVLTNAAVEGARIASLPNYVDADAESRVWEYARQSGIPDVAASGGPCWDAPSADSQLCAQVATIDLPGSSPGETWPGKEVTVTYKYNYSYIGPIAELFGGRFSSVILTTRSTMRSQTRPPAATP